MNIEKNGPAPLEPLLTPDEVATLFRIDISTLARLCRRAELPSPIKIGGSNRWRFRDIEAVLEGRQFGREERTQTEERLETKE